MMEFMLFPPNIIWIYIVMTTLVTLFKKIRIRETIEY